MGVEYLAPAAAYMVSAIATLFILVVTVYPIGVFLTTGLDPFTFMKKDCKSGCIWFFH